ncbi:ABC transporter ATP-binding protein [Alkalicoccus urumqiensis]|uniref:Sodium ABC transporter ATP-binding protein n=1 Tax=Alkalicoccus urumqiensis TaxID=1548213 RepID=A0A2P6MGU1_ALKUR|nr:ABC transporter ATP-binding protein [Alkalicoccus urumqiensis]PRO65487.1 sodium ABC transporter ATP-binding protein [Alkalicoccus urumqiensis]
MTLKLESLEKTFGSHTAVGGINAEVAPGSMFGMLGANGAGKTTTFRMILGLLDPTSGTAEWNGRRIGYDRTHLIGYLPEERGLFPKLTVKDQLVYLMRLNGMKRQDTIKEMRSWLERFQVEEYENKKVEELSKGNQQKIQFMAAVLHRPELLILDEPFSGLDPVNADMLKEAVLSIQKNGTTIVFSSHQMRNVEELCEEILMLKEGRVVLEGHLNDIKRSYSMKNIRIRADHDFSITETPGSILSVSSNKLETVVQVNGEEAVKDVFYQASADGYLRHFAVEEPSLHDIFIDKAGGNEHE